MRRQFGRGNSASGVKRDEKSVARVSEGVGEDVLPGESTTTRTTGEGEGELDGVWREEREGRGEQKGS
jgi:hypothetical protein